MKSFLKKKSNKQNKINCLWCSQLKNQNLNDHLTLSTCYSILTENLNTKIISIPTIFLYIFTIPARAAEPIVCHRQKKQKTNKTTTTCTPNTNFSYFLLFYWMSPTRPEKRLGIIHTYTCIRVVYKNENTWMIDRKWK